MAGGTEVLLGVTAVEPGVALVELVVPEETLAPGAPTLLVSL